jgi:hypothetical protein
MQEVQNAMQNRKKETSSQRKSKLRSTEYSVIRDSFFYTWIGRDHPPLLN